MAANTVKCPECGADVAAYGVPAHLEYHWTKGCPDRDHYPDACKRYLALKTAGLRAVQAAEGGK